jgi:glutamine phosphoribosylpyrophosphate amidotransferase
VYVQSPDKKPVYILSSESCAMHTVGADFVRDVAPGEIIRIDKSGVHSSIGATLPPQKKVRRPHHLHVRVCVCVCVCNRG